MDSIIILTKKREDDDEDEDEDEDEEEEYDWNIKKSSAPHAYKERKEGLQISERSPPLSLSLRAEPHWLKCGFWTSKLLSSCRSWAPHIYSSE